MKAAALSGNAQELAELMRQDPGFDVNAETDEWESTLLHNACLGDSKSVIPLLLAHPDIDVNMRNAYGITPFAYACSCDSTSCVRLLLKVSRVKVNEPANDGTTPLFFLTARNGRLDTIKWWIASGREIDLGEPGEYTTDAIGRAKEKGETGVVTLLERFKEHPEETRHAMRVELGLLDDLAAEMFALVVFVSDGLLQVNDTTTPSPAARFFTIATQLPLELQMVLYFRQVGSDKEIIPGKESEAAFKKLARRLW